MASANFTHLGDSLAKGLIDFDNDSFKAALVTVDPTANLGTWLDYVDITNECVDGDYTAGGFVATVGTISTTGPVTSVPFTAGNPTYSSSTISALGCIIYLDTGVPANDLLVGWVDFGGTVSSTNGDYTVSFADDLTITV